MATPEEKERERKGELASVVPFIRRALAGTDPARVEQARIRVEDIAGPILLVSGTEDRTWPSTEFCDDIEARLEAARFPHEVTHVVLEGGGHPSFLPWLITANRGGGIDGGSPRANVRGGYRSWAETIAFLRRHLGR
jgi:dienelactone hydrolase